MKNTRILSVDYGEARTGLAISDHTATIATPLAVIRERNFGVLIEKIAQTAKENGVGEVVVGNPVNMDGTKGAKSLKCTELAAQLRDFFAAEDMEMTVALWDERLTTVSALGIINANNPRESSRRKKRAEQVDAIAAAVILEGYLGYLKKD
jgi:putative Holliday junction resolvase